MANSGMNARAFEGYTVSIITIVRDFTSITTWPHTRQNTLRNSSTDASCRLDVVFDERIVE